MINESNIPTPTTLSPPSRSNPTAAFVFANEQLLGDEAAKRIPSLSLINKINHLHFTDAPVAVLFPRKDDSGHLLLYAEPGPCQGRRFTCRIRTPEESFFAQVRDPDWLLIDDGRSMILSPVACIKRQNDVFDLELPDEASAAPVRRAQRFSCRNITCVLRQGDLEAQGSLLNFSPMGMAIIPASPGAPGTWNEKQPFEMTLFEDDVKLFSGWCRCLRSGGSDEDGKMVFEPVEDRISLYPKSDFRNPRPTTTPSFAVRFRHPFSHVIQERDVADISTSGFSIREDADRTTLVPGMFLPDVSLLYAGVAEMHCSAQVVYRRHEDNERQVQFGMTICDMDIDAFTTLNHLVGTHLDSGARVSTTVDMDELWKFFFDTNFIYGEKYIHLSTHRDAFKAVYHRLYKGHPRIARHFTYHKNGTIYAHIAMIHAYETSWIIHHFSAKPLDARVPGLLILRQIVHFLTGYYRMQSRGFETVMTYYRPENKIVERIFGGFANFIKNPKGCSLDLFAYLYLKKTSAPVKLPQGWSLRPSGIDDFRALERFYEDRSGGLLLDALKLEKPISSIKEEFAAAGFKRNCQTLCLCEEDLPRAFFIVEESDIGLNLSDLLNGIKAIILQPDRLPWTIFESVVNMLGSFYADKEIPLLIYPDDYPATQNVDISKKYRLWILAGSSAEAYTEYMLNKFRIKYKVG